MSEQIRAFDISRDLTAVQRIWREVGWIDDDRGAAMMQDFFAVGHTLVATIDDVPECSVHIAPGTLAYGSTPLPLCAVTAVTTSRIARGHAFAQRLTARQLQQGAQRGDAVAALGMFDQGFYDKLGFGTGSYDHQFLFDPGTLRVEAKVPSPVRLSLEDYEQMHAVMLARPQVHGSVCLSPPRLFRAELGFEENAFGLGYRSDGALTHFVWLSGSDTERGPYTVDWIGYQNSAQLMQLLSLLKSLADQVYSLSLIEPPELQLQALLERPLRHRDVSKGSKHAAQHRSLAWWQMRILDLQACIGAYTGRGACSFAVCIDDPIETWLEQGQWRGCGGWYLVELGGGGEISPIDEQQAQAHPILHSSINAFSRWWWGVATASQLALTDAFAAPPQLLETLDEVVQLPTPRVGWDF